MFFKQPAEASWSSGKRTTSLSLCWKLKIMIILPLSSDPTVSSKKGTTPDYDFPSMKQKIALKLLFFPFFRINSPHALLYNFVDLLKASARPLPSSGELSDSHSPYIPLWENNISVNLGKSFLSRVWNNNAHQLVSLSLVYPTPACCYR